MNPFQGRLQGRRGAPVKQDLRDLPRAGGMHRNQADARAFSGALSHASTPFAMLFSLHDANCVYHLAINLYRMFRSVFPQRQSQ